MIEVLEAPDTDLVDLATVKLHLSVTGDDDDATIAAIIARASASVISYLGFNLLAGEYREIVEPVAGQVQIALSRLPVMSITTVVVDGSELATGYRCNTDAGMLLRTDAAGRSRSWEPRAVVAVTYTAGYATTPADIQAAVLTLVGSEWTQRGRDPSLKGIGIGSINLSYFTPDALPSIATVEPLLSPYRQPAVG